MKVYLVCFDITDDHNRTKAGKLLLRYGERVQRSVFEIAINKARELNELREDLLEYVEPGDDLRFYYLNSETRKQSQDIHGNTVADFPAVIII